MSDSEHGVEADDKYKEVRIKKQLRNLKTKLQDTKDNLMNILAPSCETRIKHFGLTKRIDMEYDYSKIGTILKNGTYQQVVIMNVVKDIREVSQWHIHKNCIKIQI